MCWDKESLSEDDRTPFFFTSDCEGAKLLATSVCMQINLHTDLHTCQKYSVPVGLLCDGVLCHYFNIFIFVCIFLIWYFSVFLKI